MYFDMIAHGPEGGLMVTAIMVFVIMVLGSKYVDAWIIHKRLEGEAEAEMTRAERTRAYEDSKDKMMKRSLKIGDKVRYWEMVALDGGEIRIGTRCTTEPRDCIITQLYLKGIQIKLPDGSLQHCNRNQVRLMEN